MTSAELGAYRCVADTHLGDSVAEIGDVAADGPDGGQLLPLAEPLLHLDRLFVHHEDVDGQVTEGVAQGAAGSLDGDNPRLDGGLHSLRYLDQLVRVDHLHRDGGRYFLQEPRGPLTVTTRDLTEASTPSGILTSWFVL